MSTCNPSGLSDAQKIEVAKLFVASHKYSDIDKWLPNISDRDNKLMSIYIIA